MVESMTGFGRAETQVAGFSVDVEMRSVNNRYCDVSVKLPNELVQHEQEFRSELQKKFERGKISVSVKMEQHAAKDARVQINHELASVYYRMLLELAESVGMDDRPGLKELLSFSEIYERGGIDDAQKAQLLAAVSEGMETAAAQLIRMRQEEGRALADDLLERVAEVERITGEIEQLSVGRVEEARHRLHERIQQLLADDNYDKDRLELEIAVLADKMDITEELVRMASHVNFFREALAGKAASGRKLNFLMQEMLRETNTIGSKASNAEIAHKVVEIKEIIEIIREQIQNLA